MATGIPEACRLRHSGRCHLPVASITTSVEVEAGEPALQLADALARIGHPQPLAAGQDTDVEPVLAHVDAYARLGLGLLFGRFLALHAGRAPYHLWRTRAEGRADQALPRCRAPRGNSVPPARVGAGGHRPRRASQIAAIRSAPRWQVQHARGTSRRRWRGHFPAAEPVIAPSTMPSHGPPAPSPTGEEASSTATPGVPRSEPAESRCHAAHCRAEAPTPAENPEMHLPEDFRAGARRAAVLDRRRLCNVSDRHRLRHPDQPRPRLRPHADSRHGARLRVWAASSPRAPPRQVARTALVAFLPMLATSSFSRGSAAACRARCCARVHVGFLGLLAAGMLAQHRRRTRSAKAFWWGLGALASSSASINGSSTSTSFTRAGDLTADLVDRRRRDRRRSSCSSGACSGRPCRSWRDASSPIACSATPALAAQSPRL